MDFIALAQQCAPQVAISTIAAVVKTESNYHPWAIGINGKERLSRQPISREQAIATAKWLLNNGYNIDMGLGQINHKNLKRFNLSVEEVFDPCRNLAVTGAILKEHYQKARKRTQSIDIALYAALSGYNTGSLTKGLSNGYVKKVVINAGSKVPSILKNKQSLKNTSKSKLHINKSETTEYATKKVSSWDAFGELS